MSANKKNLEKRFSLSTLVLALSLILTTNVAIADADDDAKLKELERAMSGSTQTGQKKLRTRAIVFDNQEGDKASNNTSNAATLDCASLPTGVAATVVDFPIQFNVGSATISSGSEQTLGQIAKVLSLNTNCVFVEGHTDASGNPDQNRILSQSRAVAVVDFLANRAGLDRKRLVAVGKGSSEPAKGLDARDPKNRRVAFKVVSGA